MSSDIPRAALYSPPDEGLPPIRPTWSRPSRHSRTRTSSSSNVMSTTSNMWSLIRKTQSQALRLWKRLTLIQKILLVIAVVVTHVLMLLGLIYHETIFEKLTPIAQQWSDLPAGWLILFFWTFFSAFPPLIGYSTSVTLAGFVFHLKGWFIAASGTIAGSTCAFIVCRIYFRSFAQKMVNSDKRFAALSLTLKHDGLKLLCMIRLCPLPYSISNAALSTFPTVSPLKFALATAVATPKLIIHVFIGSKMRELGEMGGKIDGSTKAVNYLSIIFGALIGGITGWVIYRRTVKRANELEAEERRRARAGEFSPSATRVPDPGYFDDPLEAQAEATLEREEGDDDYIDLEDQDPQRTKNSLAGKALSAFNDLLGRKMGNERGVDDVDGEHDGFLDGHDSADEDAEELLVVEDHALELEDNGWKNADGKGMRRP